MMWWLAVAWAGEAYIDPPQEEYCEGQEAVIQVVGAPEDHQMTVWVKENAAWSGLWVGQVDNGRLRVPLFGQLGMTSEFMVTVGATQPPLHEDGCLVPTEQLEGDVKYSLRVRSRYDCESVDAPVFLPQVGFDQDLCEPPSPVYETPTARPNVAPVPREIYFVEGVRFDLLGYDLVRSGGDGEVLFTDVTSLSCRDLDHCLLSFREDDRPQVEEVSLNTGAAVPGGIRWQGEQGSFGALAQWVGDEAWLAARDLPLLALRKGVWTELTTVVSEYPGMGLLRGLSTDQGEPYRVGSEVRFTELPLYNVHSDGTVVEGVLADDWAHPSGVVWEEGTLLQLPAADLSEGGATALAEPVEGQFIFDWQATEGGLLVVRMDRSEFQHLEFVSEVGSETLFTGPEIVLHPGGIVEIPGEAWLRRGPQGALIDLAGVPFVVPWSAHVANHDPWQVSYRQYGSDGPVLVDIHGGHDAEAKAWVDKGGIVLRPVGEGALAPDSALSAYIIARDAIQRGVAEPGSIRLLANGSDGFDAFTFFQEPFGAIVAAGYGRHVSFAPLVWGTTSGPPLLVLTAGPDESHSSLFGDERTVARRMREAGADVELYQSDDRRWAAVNWLWDQGR